MTLRRRLVLTLLAIVTLALSGVGLALYRAASSYLVSSVDNRLEGFIAVATQRFPVDVETVPPAGAGRLVSPFAEQGLWVSVPTGRLPGFQGFQGFIDGTDSLAAPDVAGIAADGRIRTVSSVGAGQSSRFRIVAASDPQTNEATITALSLSSTDKLLRRLLFVEISTALGALAATALLARWLIEADLAPLRRLERTAALAADGDLAVRFEDRGTRTESGRLGRAFNVMIERIDASFRSERQSQEALRRFVADASHELRTPLTSIRGYAELSRDQRASAEERSRFLWRIEQEAARLGGLVEDLTQLARLDEGPTLQYSDFDLSSVARVAAEDARVAWGELDIEVVEAPTPVWGDRARLTQVAVNLLSNAAAHTPPGTKVTVSARPVLGGGGKLVVEDNGPGIAPELAARAFERFARDDTRSRDRGGSGLGLAIVAAIANAHGGSAEVETALGKGTRFIVTVPPATSKRTDH